MAILNALNARDLLESFLFTRLFMEELGWLNPSAPLSESLMVEEISYTLRRIAHLGGVMVLEVQAESGSIPDAKTRVVLHKEVSKRHHENLLIFVDAARTQSLWYWVKRDGKKSYPREHLLLKGVPGDLFLAKLSAMVVDISELDARGDVSVAEAARRLQSALDVERVTKKFFGEFKEQHSKLIDQIEGIDDPRQRRWYASVLLHRLMFVYFLQSKGFLDNDNRGYLQEKLRGVGSLPIAVSDSGGFTEGYAYYEVFLKALFFEGFAKPKEKRPEPARSLVGEIPYLNGGLFLRHTIEEENPSIRIPDQAFVELLSSEEPKGLFARYSWQLDDTPGGRADEISPDTLGYIFEKYINQKAFGAYYTRPEITEYLCEQTIHRLILDKVHQPALPGITKGRHYDSLSELLLNLDAPLCKELLEVILPRLSLLDPACGSGAFLVAAMKTLINVYSAVTGRIPFLNDRGLDRWLADVHQNHKSLPYHIKREIITKNLYGVDIMPESIEIAKLRLFLALVASARTVDDLEPLPNIDFNLLSGNSLIGLMHVNDQTFNDRYGVGDLFAKSYKELLSEKNLAIRNYQSASGYTDQLQALRKEIEDKKAEARPILNAILTDNFRDLRIKYEQATWDDAKNQEGKPTKRAVTVADVEALEPFHWGYEFDEIIHGRGGFDAIITNPPWDVFQTDEKEFASEYDDTIQKNKIRIEDWKTQFSNLMKDDEFKKTWLDYASRFSFVSQYYKNSPQYKNQISKVNGKNVGSKINLYSYFTEQSFNLLRNGGQCGIVIPSGIYTDLGAKQLREMLFSETIITGLFCFENRKMIFEGVDSRFKFVVLSFDKEGHTESFPTAFMRHEVSELVEFPKRGALTLSVETIKRLSPDSLSIPEFKSEIDAIIAEKLATYPRLGEQIQDTWNLSLTSEFNMTTDSYLFKTTSAPNCFPLYEGKMIHQFTASFAKPKYWIIEKEARANLIKQNETDNGQKLDYQYYRLGFRDIARNTDERTMISSIMPPAFHGNKFPTLKQFSESGERIISYFEQLLLCSILNSFICDWELRNRVTTTINFHFVYAMFVPRLTTSDPWFSLLVNRAAKLICTTPEFDDLAAEVGLGTHANGVTDPAERAVLRAEIDGIVAHLYNLTEDEFKHILSTFPLVKDPVKAAALQAYHDIADGKIVPPRTQPAATQN
ncbi:Eco57I restriction-modification methylase domain-containing protein [Armatimonas sp.]|uniref:Eco57I restriction-modification methylase domain-containing protein n=1 Tax=Armatimonas sp. TaxID=1872638 RepID=UPI003753C38B